MAQAEVRRRWGRNYGYDHRPGSEFNKVISFEVCDTVRGVFLGSLKAVVVMHMVDVICVGGGVNLDCDADAGIANGSAGGAGRTRVDLTVPGACGAGGAGRGG